MAGSVTGQTNGHVVARREVSAEDLSKQLLKRHCFPLGTIEQRS